MIQMLIDNFGVACTGGKFLGFPTWYAYLEGTKDAAGNCTPVISGINDVWLIVAAVIEILLRIGVIAAIVMVVYGGVGYVMSQGEPDKTTNARNTIINALVGLAISTLAAVIIAFLARSIPR